MDDDSDDSDDCAFVLWARKNKWLFLFLCVAGLVQVGIIARVEGTRAVLKDYFQDVSDRDIQKETKQEIASMKRMLLDAGLHDPSPADPAEP